MPTYTRERSHWAKDHWAMDHWAGSHWFDAAESIDTDTAARFCLLGDFGTLVAIRGQFVLVDTSAVGGFGTVLTLAGTWDTCGS